jgi:hypothetical protein
MKFLKAFKINMVMSFTALPPVVSSPLVLLTLAVHFELLISSRAFQKKSKSR